MSNQPNQPAQRPMPPEKAGQVEEVAHGQVTTYLSYADVYQQEVSHALGILIAQCALAIRAVEGLDAAQMHLDAVREAIASPEIQANVVFVDKPTSSETKH